MNKKTGLILLATLLWFSCTPSFAKENVIHSKKELKAAISHLREYRDELNLTGYSINENINGLTISADKWTPEKEEKIKQLLGIENIEFITDYGVADEGGIKVRLMPKTSDDAIYFFNSPVVDNTVLVPVRGLFESLGYQIFWNNEEKKVTAVNDNNKLIFTLSEKEVLFINTSSNETTILSIDIAPMIENNSIYIPVDFISEVSDYSVTKLERSSTTLIE